VVSDKEKQALLRDLAFLSRYLPLAQDSALENG
jgi:hypothetical protein